jgi:hypothetical protein
VIAPSRPTPLEVPSGLGAEELLDRRGLVSQEHRLQLQTPAERAGPLELVWPSEVAVDQREPPARERTGRGIARMATLRAGGDTGKRLCTGPGLHADFAA